LIGGSVALTLRAKSPDTTISIWGRRPEQLQEILKRGLADSVETDPAIAVREASLVVLCTPVGTMRDLAQAILPGLSPATVITDAGSVKATVVDQLETILGGRFVGAHPMAGSERSGLGAAQAHLFEGAPCLITPTGKSDPAALARVSEFWKSVGCSVTTMNAAEHDRLVARISHLPHALAFALVNLIVDTLSPEAQQLAGGSFRDATRVAASDPSLWTGILTENRTEVAAALREMSKLLKSMATALGDENPDSILDFLKRAKDHRDSLPLPRPEENP
jgi:prephenate dehydrogenase